MNCVFICFTVIEIMLISCMQSNKFIILNIFFRKSVVIWRSLLVNFPVTRLVVSDSFDDSFFFQTFYMFRYRLFTNTQTLRYHRLAVTWINYQFFQYLFFSIGHPIGHPIRSKNNSIFRCSIGSLSALHDSQIFSIPLPQLSIYPAR